MIRMHRRAMLKSAASAAALAPFACSQSSDDATAAADPDVMDGVALANAISSGELTALEATNAAIARAQAVNGELNAIASKTFEAALDQAEAAPDGAFAGVPTFMKDLIDWRGAPTLYGSRAFAGYVAPADGPLAARWREAGLVVLGKSTTPEAGLISSTEPLVTGPTRNPWSVDRIPGGSSGGAAALVAARVVPFAHATDGGGSIRIPAACCGLFGLKPSAGRLAATRAGPPPAVDISVGHAVTLTVRDSAALFEIAERSDSDLDPIGRVEGPSTRRLKIGFAPVPPIDAPMHPDTVTELERTAELCRELGHEVVDANLDFDGARFADRFLLYWAAGAAQFAQSASEFAGVPIGPDIVEPWTLGLIQLYQSKQDQMDETIAYLQSFQTVYESWFDGFDVLLTPVVSTPAPEIGTQDPTGDFETTYANVTSFAAFTSPMNVAGAPSMSVPLGHASERDLPIGSMFSARRGEDRTLFELAYELEAARPWIGRTPPVSAI